jgi:putative photosynthetic complex assembly protein 2
MMMILAALAIALLSWWLLTGLVLWGSRGSPLRQRLSMAVWSVGLMVGLSVHAEASRSDTAVASLLCFLAVLAVWAWQEAAFLVGVVTGPNRARATPDLVGWRRFWRAFLTVSHHEVALLALFAALLIPALGASNQTGLATFAVLWIMRLSAKLHLMLGVKNFYEEFLPGRLSHMATYFRRRDFNWLLPLSIGAGLWMAYALWDLIHWSGQSSGITFGFSLVLGLVILAVLEHLLLFLPFQPQRLWSWALRSDSSVIRGRTG